MDCLLCYQIPRIEAVDLAMTSIYMRSPHVNLALSPSPFRLLLQHGRLRKSPKRLDS